ncbi:hypothetical protein BDR26DRAFT_988757 [Obelidium mucronatum]|nr:hypothetical protein BDR26DRAFT_988757 [Obelidium mucronatum]
MQVWSEIKGGWRCNVCQVILANLPPSIQQRHEVSQKHTSRLPSFLRANVIHKAEKESRDSLEQDDSPDPDYSDKLDFSNAENRPGAESHAACAESHANSKTDTHANSHEDSLAGSQADSSDDSHIGSLTASEPDLNADTDDKFSSDSEFSVNHNSQRQSEDEEEELEDADFILETRDSAYSGWNHQLNPENWSRGKFFPFRSLHEFKLSKLFSRTRSVMYSRDQETEILDVFRAVVPDLPPHNRILSLRSTVRELLNVHPREWKLSPTVSVFYIPIATSIRLAFGNPRIRAKLNVIPVEKETQSKLWESSRWKESIQTPMVQIIQNNEPLHIFIDEVYFIKEIEGFLPFTFVKDENGSLFAIEFSVLFDLDSEFWLISADVKKAPVEELKHWFLCPVGTKILWETENGKDAELETSIRNGSKLREKAAGKRVFVAPICLFNDDTSGNISKKWNKYESLEFTLAGLPFHDIQQLNNINFICTTNEASAIECCPVIVDCLRDLRRGILVYDAVLHEEVIVVGKCFLSLSPLNIITTAQCCS